MKISKRILSLLIVVVMMFSLSIAALAKTSSDVIDAPADTEKVFTVNAGSLSTSYTWADINGKNTFKSETHTYAAKVDGEQATQDWTGVMLADILADAATKLGVTIADDYKISATAADGYVVAFTAEDVRDESNVYMIAPDPVKNYDDENDYGNSYVRILRYGTEQTSNMANVRCVTGITILDADGKALPVGGKTQGGDVDNAVFYIAVKESADSAYKYYYYTMTELQSYDDKHDFAYVDHTVAKTVTGRGASLANLLDDITDAEITDDMIIQYAESDGYHADAATAIEESSYKDKVAWLSNTHTTAGGDTAAAVDTMVCYQSWTKYDTPDETNVDSTEWEDADAGSGYLRAYRQRDDANSAVIKTLMGVVVSYSGQEFTGKDGYTLKAQSDKGDAIKIFEPSTGKTYASQSITGLVPGMKYAVKAPTVTNAALAAGETAAKVITAAAGTDTVVTFKYTEKTYFTLTSSAGTTAYTLTTYSTADKAVETPSAEEVTAHGTPYGYYNAMYYRYNGMWLSDLTGVSGDVTVKGADGSLVIKAADLSKYFLAYGYTASKSSTNVSEGKRFSYAYSAPVLIIPSEGTLVGEAEVGAEGNKMVSVALKDVASISVGAIFSDMGNYAWADTAVNYLYNAGVVNGVGDGKYAPAANIKRGDFILMLIRASGLTSDSTENFADVAPELYYAKAIAIAKANDIARGDGTNFYPETAITRQEAMTLICRTLAKMGDDFTGTTSDLSEFKDASLVADWALDSVKALVGADIIHGSDGMLNPLGNMSRAEMAVVLYNATSRS